MRGDQLGLAQRAEIRSLLEASQPFGPLQSAELDEVLDAFVVRTAPAGTVVLREGEPADAMFVVVRGRVRITSSKGGTIAELGKGDVLGEIALITGGERNASAISIRNSVLAELPATEFLRVVLHQPQALLSLSRLIIGRLSNTTPDGRRQRDGVAIALVGASEDAVNLKDFARQFAAELAKIGATTVVDHDTATAAVGGAGELARLDWFARQESAHAFTLYVANRDADAWTQRCLRQSDRVLFVAGAASAGRDRNPAERAFETLPADSAPRATLVLLHPAGTKRPIGTRSWLAGRRVADCYHVRDGDTAQFGRLARLVTDRATGVVFGGGGARGFAHIGLMRAARELGLAFDMVGGTSAGAIMAGMCALELDWEQMLTATHDAFVKNPPQGDYTLPLVSLASGKRFSHSLRVLFEDIDIEDLWLPFFCVSTNITRAQSSVHRSGLLRQWVRASGSLPGAAPPVVVDGELFMDGCILNNLPADVMRQQTRGKVIAIDIDQHFDLSTTMQASDQMSGWRQLWDRVLPWGRKRRRIPSIVRILHRTATITSVQARQRASVNADLYLHPPVEEFGVFEFPAYRKIAEAGYAYGRQELARWLSEGHGPGGTTVR